VLAEQGREGARELLHEIVAGITEPQAGGETAHIAFLVELERVAAELGSLEESRRLRESVPAMRSRLFPPDHPDILAAKQLLALTRKALAQALAQPPEGARSALVAQASFELGELAQALGLPRVAARAWVRARAFREATLPAEHAELARAQHALAVALRAGGDLAGARALQEPVLEVRTRTLAANDPPEEKDGLQSCGARLFEEDPV
jgi:hypothetical protein